MEKKSNSGMRRKMEKRNGMRMMASLDQVKSNT